MKNIPLNFRRKLALGIARYTEKQNAKDYKKTVGRLLSGALALLGFAGCNIGDEPVLYGSPSVDYRVMGTITDTNGKPIQGIRVVVADEDVINGKIYAEDYPWVTSDTTYTDNKGQFSSSKINDISYTRTLIDIQDIDDEANGGVFNEKRLHINHFEKKQVKKKDGWYSGEFEFSKDIQLTKRK